MGTMRRSIALVCTLVACIEPSCSQWQSLNGGVSWEVRAFAISTDGAKLLVGGSFPYVYQDSLRANGLAWWDGEEWSIEGLAGGNGDTTVTGSTNPVLSLAISPDTIFASYLDVQWQNTTELRYASMLVDGVWQPCGRPESTFFFMGANGRLFNGGRADTLYGQFMPMANEWTEGEWQPVPGYSFSTTALVVDACYWQDRYYFGGVFNALGSRKIVAFDGLDQWFPLGGGVGGNFIESLCGYGDSLYVGGFFLPGQDVQSKHAQIWDGEEWKPFFPQVQFIGVVRDMQVHDGALYISGIHTWAGDTTWYGLLRYDGHQLCSIGGPMPSGDNGPMAFFQGKLYLGISPMFPAMPNEFVAYLPLEGLVPDTCITISPTSVVERSARQRLTIQPNPTDGEFQLTLPRGFVGEGELTIMDELGRVCHRARVVDRQTAWLGLQELTNGLYTITLAQGELRWHGRVILCR